MIGESSLVVFVLLLLDFSLKNFKYGHFPLGGYLLWVRPY